LQPLSYFIIFRIKKRGVLKNEKIKFVFSYFNDLCCIFTGLVDGVDTNFTVVIEYNLYSYTQGEVQVGFNNGESINSFRIVNNAEFLVNKGSGTHEFNVTVKPKDWGSQGDFSVYVNISEYPHPSTWTPLDGDTRVLTFN